MGTPRRCHACTLTSSDACILDADINNLRAFTSVSLKTMIFLIIQMVTQGVNCVLLFLIGGL